MNKLVALVPVVLAWACIGAGSEAGAATADEDAIQQVVGGYFAAFAKDSAAASDFYGEPALIVRPTQVRALSTAAEVQGFLVEELARLKPQGYAYSNIGEHHIRMLNPATALYSAVAQRMKADGTELMKVGFTYLLHKDDAGWKIHENIATDLDKLVKSE